MADAKLTELLQRLSPQGGGLDRDLLLFEAGRAAARPSRLWPSLTGLLAASQAGLLVVMFWPVSPPQVTAPEAPAMALSSEAIPAYVADLAHWLATDELPRPAASGRLPPDGQPSRAVDWRRWTDE